MTKTRLDYRPASDIAEEIRDFMRSFDPLKQGVHHLSFEINDEGWVTLRGNVRTIVARRILVDNIPDFDGVLGLEEDQLFDDETLRLTIGKTLPMGVMVRVNYGFVTLSGLAPDDEENLIQNVQEIPGVVKVITQFS